MLEVFTQGANGDNLVESVGVWSKDIEQVQADLSTSVSTMIQSVADGPNPIQKDLLSKYFSTYQDFHQKDFDNTNGQFQFLYTSYGPMFAQAAACYQSKLVEFVKDETFIDSYHRKGGTGTMDKLFSSLYVNVPKKYHKVALDSFVRYNSVHGFTQAYNFLRHAPNVVRYIIQKGKQNLLDDYFRICSLTPWIPCNYRSDYAYYCADFPISDGEKALEELESLNTFGELKEDVFQFKTKVFKFGKEREGIFGSNHELSFGSTYMNELCPTGYTVGLFKAIHSLKIAEYSLVKIRAILRDLSERPEIESISPYILLYYETINSNFPGGVKCFIEYISGIENYHSRCKIIDIVVLKKLPKKNTLEFLGKGIELEKSSSEHGQYIYEYYEIRRHQHARINQLIEKDPAKFSQVIDKAKAFADKFPRYIRTTMFQFYIIYYDNENLPKAEEGFMHALSVSKKLNLEDKFGSYIDGCLNLLTQVSGLDFESQVINPHGNIADLDFSEVCELFSAVYSKFGRTSVEKIGKARRLIETGDSVKTALKTFDTYLSLESLEEGYIGNLDCSIQEAYDRIAYLERVEKERHEYMLDFSTTRMRKNLKKQEKALMFKSFLSAGLPTDLGEVPLSGFFQNTNPDTKGAIGGAALMGALGLMQVPERERMQLKSLPVEIGQIGQKLGFFERDGSVANLDKSLSQADIRQEMTSSIITDYFDIVRENVKVLLPYYEQLVLKARINNPGFMPIGGKVHTVVSMPDSVISALNGLFGLRSTPFKMIHANRSLVLPPMVTSLELQLLIDFLKNFGLFDGGPHSIQTAGGGRLDERHASVVGSGLLLGTNYGVRYKKGAFRTNFDVTGARIMAYDDGVKVKGRPYDLDNAPGRTDKIGTNSYFDIYLHQLIHTTIGHNQFGGIFSKLGEEFERQIHMVLNKHSLLPSLRKSAWVFDNSGPGDSIEDHEAMVGEFTGAWFESNAKGSGIIHDVQRTTRSLADELARRRPDTIRRNPKEYERMLRF